jgi:hypothetical protein
MFDQFFSRKTVYALGALVVLHGLAWIAAPHASVSLVLLTIFALALGWLTYTNLTLALMVVLLEIMIGGHGHLFSASFFGVPLSLRMVLFLVFMSVWVMSWVRGVSSPIWSTLRTKTPFLTLFLPILLGGFFGFLQNGHGAWFDDVNSYATLLYIFPMASIAWTNEKKSLLLHTLAIGAIWVAFTTLALLFLFTHLQPSGIWVLYAFVRDARLFEVTLLSGPSWLVAFFGGAPWYFRVFSQGQFFVCIFFILWCIARVRGVVSLRKGFFVDVSCLAIIIASLSRSFWLGLVAAGTVLLGFVLWGILQKEWGSKAVLKILGYYLMVVPCVAILLWAVIVFPLPQKPDLLHSSFYKGQNDNTRDLAVSSRWNLLGPLSQSIAEHPVSGSGFGKQITYISDDPRLRAINPSGEYTTYRFEWGFHDIWLKMGLPGILAMIAVLIWFFQRAFFAMLNRHAASWLAIGVSSAVVFLFVTHIFSPFINHPMGLAFLLFGAFLIDDIGQNKKKPVSTMASPVALLPPTPLLARTLE